MYHAPTPTSPHKGQTCNMFPLRLLLPLCLLLPLRLLLPLCLLLPLDLLLHYLNHRLTIAAVRETSLNLRSQPYHPSVPKPCWIKFPRKPFNIFLVHRGPDTKETEATLIYKYLRAGGYFPFLDVESLMPGKKIPDGIDEALRESKLGVIIFSPRFGESHHCLDELVRLMEMGKPLLPIFCDIEPSELRVAEYRMGRDTAEKVKEYRDALDEAKQVQGLRFQRSTGNRFKLGRDTVMAVDGIFVELGEECPPRHEGSPGFYPACRYTPGLGATEG